VLRFDGLGAAALADLFFLVLDSGEQINDAAGVLFEFGRFQIPLVSESKKTREALTHSDLEKAQANMQPDKPSLTVYEF